MKKTILDLCGGTGSWSKPYREAYGGHEYIVVVVDTKHPDPDIKSPFGDIALIEKHTLLDVHGILAAPPCTMFAVSGNRWRAKEKAEGTYEKKLAEALKVVDTCLRLVYAYKPKFWAIENPVGTLHKFIGKPVMTFQPYEYGDPYTKRTCLWGDFNIPKKNPVEPIEKSKMHKLPPSKDRAMKRSITPPGFAKAFFLSNR